MKHKFAFLLLPLFIAGSLTTPAVAQPADFQWTLDASGILDYEVTAASPEVLSSTPADDPTLNLIVGKRYRVINNSSDEHPVAFIAKGSGPGSDSTLLAQGSANGSQESNAGVAWVDSGGSVTFTMTQTLLDAMRTSGRVPGYRCQTHPDLMRGNFNVTSPPTFDFQWTFGSTNGTADFNLTAVSSPELFSGTLPARDPTIRLTVGKRYRVSNPLHDFHPLEILAKGPSVETDVTLMSQGNSIPGLAFESDAGVAWVDSGNGIIEFTVTEALFNAMSVAEHNPGYRCGIHSDVMRGNFIFGNPTPTPTPMPTLSPTPSPTGTPMPTASPTATPIATLTAEQIRLILLGSATPDPAGDANLDSAIDIADLIRALLP